MFASSWVLAVLACSTRDVSTLPPSNETQATTSSESGATTPGEADDLATWIRAHYDKQEFRIPMRDGVELFTAIYVPKTITEPVPVMLFRTPYSVGPYGEDQYRDSLGPSEILARKGWIFVYQDVRGRFMSDGDFVNMTPHVADKKSKDDIDESTDTYDTIEWVLANVDGHNGRVGQWGISYPGFYTAAGMIDAHPALKASSPQAPIADWFFDDFHHHGAFFLPHAFNFLAVFGLPREGRMKEWPPRFDHGTPDGYAFFQELGPLRNVNERYYEGKVAFWNDIVTHPNYDEFWEARNLLPHLDDVAPAVMTVGGWFDAEDLYGPLHIYQSVEERNPDVDNMLVMGPWVHGGWARGSGRRIGRVDFGSETSEFYQREIEAPFFEHHLADGPKPDLPEAYVFETGANRWRTFDAWPPENTVPFGLYAAAEGRLSKEPPTAAKAFDAWTSDPRKPVPFTEDIANRMTREYMVDDQRFAARRPDVVVYETEPLKEAVTIAGPITAHLVVSTSETASDFVVKLVDVFPDDATMPAEEPDEGTVPFGGYAMMVRSEVIRARFREGYAEPKPMKPGKPTPIDLPLQDVLHTFEPGHRIQIQIQSTWFPLVDINPHRYVDNVFLADEGDFIPATQRVWRSKENATWIEMNALQSPTP